VRKADNLSLSCAVFTKSGSLNLLEPSGPVQTCNGTALPLKISYQDKIASVLFYGSLVLSSLYDEGILVKVGAHMR